MKKNNGINGFERPQDPTLNNNKIVSGQGSGQTFSTGVGDDVYNAIAKKNTKIVNEDLEAQSFAAYGGFWRRLAASNWDYWPAFLASMLAILAFGVYLMMNLDVFMAEIIPSLEEGVTSDSVFSSPWSVGIVLVIGVILLSSLVNLIYNIVLYYKRGTTIGYEVFKIRVISEKTGFKPNNKILFLRWLYKTLMISFIFMIADVFFEPGALAYVVMYAIAFVVLVAAVMPIAINTNKKSLYDKFANTVVVAEEVKRVWLVWFTNMIIPVLLIGGVVVGLIFTNISVVVDDDDNYTLDEDKQVMKAEDSLNKAELSMLKTEGAVYFNQEKSYAGFCKSERAISVFAKLSHGYNCNDLARGYAVEVQMSNGNYYCLDSNAFVDVLSESLNGSIECQKI